MRCGHPQAMMSGTLTCSSVDLLYSAGAPLAGSSLPMLQNIASSGPARRNALAVTETPAPMPARRVLGDCPAVCSAGPGTCQVWPEYQALYNIGESVCYHYCSSAGSCGTSASHQAGGTDCCGCAPVGFSYNSAGEAGYAATQCETQLGVCTSSDVYDPATDGDGANYRGCLVTTINGRYGTCPPPLSRCALAPFLAQLSMPPLRPCSQAPLVDASVRTSRESVRCQD
eukprot:1326715-Rhodomonas_salina.1